MVSTKLQSKEKLVGQPMPRLQEETDSRPKMANKKGEKDLILRIRITGWSKVQGDSPRICIMGEYYSFKSSTKLHYLSTSYKLRGFLLGSKRIVPYFCSH